MSARSDSVRQLQSDHIWALVDGFPEPDCSMRNLLMLRAYFDDSSIGQSPVYVLAGWVADAWRWADFSNAWQEILDMRPRISYFKFSEASNYIGSLWIFDPIER